MSHFCLSIVNLSETKFTAPLLTEIVAGKETALVFPLAVRVPETTLLPLVPFLTEVILKVAVGNLSTSKKSPFLR